MDKTVLELQADINEMFNLQIMILVDQMEKLLNIVEDHEKDMERLADEINDLKKQLSERGES